MKKLKNIYRGKIVLTIGRLLGKLGYKYDIYKDDNFVIEWYTNRKVASCDPAAKLEISGGGNVGL